MIRWITQLLMVLSLMATVTIIPVSSFTIPNALSQNRKLNKFEKVPTTLEMSMDDERDFVAVPRRRRRGRGFIDDDEDDAAYNKYDDDDEEFDDDDDENEEEYGLFSDVVIDNPLLDSIDPDGAADRFPELASDPKFWFDIVLFLAVLEFLSSVGPRDPFPDLPWY